MRVAYGVVAALMIVGCGGLLEARESRGVSLAGLTRLGGVIVTAANDTVAEDVVRQAVERRLTKAGISVDAEPGPELLVDVSAERLNAETGTCQCGTFRVSIAVREPVTLERTSHGKPVAAITWRTSGGVRALSTEVPPVAILDVLEEQMSSFLASVASDSQQAEHEGEP